MTIIVTGGRDYSDKAKLYKVLGELIAYRIDGCDIIQGGATGADALAREFAKDRGCFLETYEANWDLHGRSAGPKRNVEMLENHPDAIVIAFPGGAGTANCIKNAISKGHVVLEVK